MNIGVFDSGLGGLFVLSHLRETLPEYDYQYLGDTARVPYGARTEAEIYQFLCEGVGYLLAHDALIVIVACNTASAEALHTLQNDWLPYHYPDRRVLGIIVPTAELCAPYQQIGIIATQRTVESDAFTREISKYAPGATIHQLATPLLVPLIESGNTTTLEHTLTTYLKELPLEQLDALVLGCTHYGIIRPLIEKYVPKNITIISQEKIVGDKILPYLDRHPEMETRLSKNTNLTLTVTKMTPEVETRAREWFGNDARVQEIHL